MTSIDAAVLEEPRSVKAPEEAVLDGTKHIHKREDLDNLQEGDVITIYQGYNYGELMSKREKFTYKSRNGKTVTFYENQSGLIKEVQLSSDKEIISRDGVVVLSEQNGMYKF